MTLPAISAKYGSKPIVATTAVICQTVAASAGHAQRPRTPCALSSHFASRLGRCIGRVVENCSLSARETHRFAVADLEPLAMFEGLRSDRHW